MGRPKKDPKDTYKGKREARKIAKMEVRKERERKKLEKKRLNEHGKGLTPDGRLKFNSHVGWKFEPRSEPEFEFEFGHKHEVNNYPEPAVEPKSESYPMSQPVTSPVKAKEESFVVKIKSCTWPDLSLGPKKISTDLPEMEISDYIDIEDSSKTSEELKIITAKKKAMQLENKNIKKANQFSKVENIETNIGLQIKEIKVPLDVYENCLKCNKTFKKTVSYTHVCKNKNKNVKKCTVCHKKTHKSSYHSTTPAICQSCGKHFKNRFTLTKHSSGCINEMPCPICGKLVKQMKQHTDFCHTSDLDKKWKCEHCGKGFLGQRHMEIHKNTHLKLKPFKCRKGCELGFADPANRGQHEKRPHKDDNMMVVDKMTKWPNVII